MSLHLAFQKMSFGHMSFHRKKSKYDCTLSWCAAVSVLSSAARSRQLPSIFCCPLIAAVPPGFFLVLLLQQIIYCCHQITANRAHISPDCLLVTYFTLFGYVCLEEMRRGWIYRLVVNAHACTDKALLSYNALRRAQKNSDLWRNAFKSDYCLKFHLKPEKI